jgi:hypothetical protein
MEIQFLYDCISGVSSLYVVPVMSLFSVTDDATYCTSFLGRRGGGVALKHIPQSFVQQVDMSLHFMFGVVHYYKLQKISSTRNFTLDIYYTNRANEFKWITHIFTAGK